MNGNLKCRRREIPRVKSMKLNNCKSISVLSIVGCVKPINQWILTATLVIQVHNTDQYMLNMYNYGIDNILNWTHVHRIIVHSQLNDPYLKLLTEYGKTIGDNQGTILSIIE